MEELHKPIIRTFGKRTVHLPFIDNIWNVYLADMQLILIVDLVKDLDSYYV